MAVKEKEAERLKKIQFVCDRCGAVLEKTAIKIIPNVVELGLVVKRHLEVRL